MNKTPELCPFCGTPPFVNRHEYRSTLTVSWEVGCSAEKCDVNPVAWGMTEQEATKRWNTRHTQAHGVDA